MTVVILSSHFAFVKPQLEKLIACKPRWRLGLWWRSGWWRSKEPRPAGAADSQLDAAEAALGEAYAWEWRPNRRAR
jgi:hypothetical protein